MTHTLPYLMLFLRPLLFFIAQSCFALYFAFSGDENPWISASKYWITFPVFANAITIFLMNSLYRRENLHYFSIFRFTKEYWWKDLLISIGVFIGASVFAMVPSSILSSLLFGSQEATADFLFSKIPLWAVVIAFLWPISHPLAELPLYFDYSMKRIESNNMSRAGALLLCSFALAFQHITLPLIFDIKYLIWRFGMFSFLALYIGLVLKLRPRLLPYIVIGHGLLDLPIVLMFL